MRPFPRSFTSPVLVLGCAILAAGCAAKTPPARFYLLQALAPTAGADASAPKVIGLGPVDIAPYLDRPQIVSGGEGAEMNLDEFQRWAEPLKDNFAQTLADNLAKRLPASHVVTFPWSRAIAPDRQVEIKVTRFHVDQNGQAELRADWTLTRPERPIELRAFNGRARVEGSGREAEVQALSRVLARFAEEIAVRLP